jgi:beta-phosphoglucomutase-like phosphatase (HAD superfamily)
MIKLVIFDLDGVLVDAKHIHYDALNEALGDQYKISWVEHLSTYDGLKTNQKLEMLSEKKQLPHSSHDEIWKKKQQITHQKLKNLSSSEELKILMEFLSEKNYKISVCSNSIRKTVVTVLSKLGVIEFIDYIQNLTQKCIGKQCRK